MHLIATTKKIQALVGVKQDGIYGPNTATAIWEELNNTGGTWDDPPENVNDQPFDPRTEKNLSTLQPGARGIFRPFVRRAMAVAAPMGVTLKVICGYRNETDQNAAKARGASKASWGYGWHNYGMAIDFGCFKGNAYLDSSDPSKANAVYAAVGAICDQYGLEWGGSWRSFRDFPHYQVNTGRSSPNAADRRALFAGTWSY